MRLLEDSMDFLRVRNFDKYQQYKDDRPLHWIKLWVSLLDDYTFSALTDTQKWHVVGCFLLAARYKNVIPNDPVYVKRAINAKSGVNLEGLIACGFLEPSVESRTDLYADKTKSVRRVREEKRREEKEKEKEQSPLAPAFSPGFLEWWDAYKETGRGGRYKKQSWQEWQKQRLEQHTKAIVARLLDQIDHRKELLDAKKFAPEFQDPHRWLKNRRWNDETT